MLDPVSKPVNFVSLPEALKVVNNLFDQFLIPSYGRSTHKTLCYMESQTTKTSCVNFIMSNGVIEFDMYFSIIHKYLTGSSDKSVKFKSVKTAYWYFLRLGVLFHHVEQFKKLEIDFEFFNAIMTCGADYEAVEKYFLSIELAYSHKQQVTNPVE